jgi:hypothetical protein
LSLIPLEFYDAAMAYNPLQCNVKPLTASGKRAAAQVGRYVCRAESSVGKTAGSDGNYK